MMLVIVFLLVVGISIRILNFKKKYGENYCENFEQK